MNRVIITWPGSIPFIIRTISSLFSTAPFGTNFSDIWIITITFNQENALKMSLETILFRSRCVKCQNVVFILYHKYRLPNCCLVTSVNWLIIRSAGTRPLVPEPILAKCQFDHIKQAYEKFESKYIDILSRKRTWRYRLRNVGHVVQVSPC